MVPPSSLLSVIFTAFDILYNSSEPVFVNILRSPEYVILDDFNSTPGTLYPRYSVTPGRVLPQV